MFGFVLHPFKQRVTQLILNWITSLNDTHRPAILEVFFLPFSLVNYFLTTLSTIIIQYAKLLGFIFVALLVLHLTLYYFIFANKIWLAITSTLLFVFSLLKSIQSYANLYVLLALAIGHFGLLCFSYNADTKDFLIKTTPIIWIALLCKLLLLSGTMGTLFIVVLISMLAIGVVAKFYGIETRGAGGRTDGLSINLSYIKAKIWSFILSLLPSHSEEDEFDLIEDQSHDSSNDEAKYFCSSPVDASSPLVKSDSTGDRVDDQSNLPAGTNESNVNETRSTMRSPERTLRRERLFKKKSFRRNSLLDKDCTKQIKTSNLSDAYLYALVWSCFLAQIYIRPHLLYLLPIPISFYLMKWLFRAIQDTELFSYYSNEVGNWIEERKEAIWNPIFCFVYEYLLVSDKVLSRTLRKSVDSLSSIVVIFGLILFLIFATIFLTFQIYHESALLVELTANVMPTINSTLANNTEFGQMLPKDLIDNNVAQEILTKGYLHGREWLQTTIRQTFGGDNPDSNLTQQVESQLLEIWDRVYHVWLRPHENENCTEDALHGPVRSFEKYNWDKLVSALKTLNLKLCFDLVKENFDIIFSIFESIWSVLKGNLRLMAGTLSAIVSVLLTGSSALLNVSLSFIVFFTSLFYLLASSNETYKPMDMAVKFMEHICSSENVNVHRFEQAVEDSITSIFTATFKISLFYGLYTWLILTLSESSIIYIPAVLAALLGAVPFIHPSFVAFIPAILEYWLVYSSGGKALLLLFFAMLPSYFVDTAIYSEIKG